MKAAGAGAGTLGTEGLLCFTHPQIGVILTVAQVGVLMIGALVLLGAILWGSERTHERVFRLLRFAANRPEPPAPAPPHRKPPEPG